MTKADRADTTYPALRSTQRVLAGLATSLGLLLACLAALLLVVMSAILFIQVIYRYVLELPLPWSEEAARFCLIWFAMLSSCVAGQQGLHFSIRWCLNWLAPGLREIARILVLALGVLVLGFIACQGLLYLSVVSDMTATATGISMFWVYLAVPVGCGALAIIQALELLDSVMGLVTHQHFGRWRLIENMALLQLLEKSE